MAQQNKAQIEQSVIEAFGPPAELCEPGAYESFLSALSRYATDAMHRKGAEQEGRLVAAAAILGRAPTQIPAVPAVARVSAYQQLRSDLNVVAREVGRPQAVRAFLEVVDRLGEPRVVTPVGGNPAVEVAVPKVPLPAWAVASLHEIRDHARKHEDGAIDAKVGLILEWLRLVSAGVPPEDIRLVPYPAQTPTQAQVPEIQKSAAPSAGRLPQ